VPRLAGDKLPAERYRPNLWRTALVQSIRQDGVRENRSNFYASDLVSGKSPDNFDPLRVFAVDATGESFLYPQRLGKLGNRGIPVVPSRQLSLQISLCDTILPSKMYLRKLRYTGRSKPLTNYPHFHVSTHSKAPSMVGSDPMREDRNMGVLGGCDNYHFSNERGLGNLKQVQKEPESKRTRKSVMIPNLRGRGSKPIMAGHLG